MWGTALSVPIGDWYGRHANGAMLEIICHLFLEFVMDMLTMDQLEIIATIVMLGTSC
jgi:hypothetical protein